MANSTQFSAQKDVSGSAVYAPPVSQYIANVVLSAGVASDIIIPPQTQIAVFSYGSGGDVWVDFKDTAILPTTSTFSFGSLILNPSARYTAQTGITKLSLICPNVNYVSIEFFWVGGALY